MWSSRACHLPNSLKLSSPITTTTILCNLTNTNRFTSFSFSSSSSSSLNFSSSPQFKPNSTLSLSSPIFSSSSISFSPPSLFFSPIISSCTSLPKRKSMASPKGRASCSSASSGRVGEGRELLVQHLLVKGDNLKLLLELQQRVSRGEDLSDLAVEYSDCPSKEQGGMLGWVRKGQMVPEFEEAAFSAPIDKVVRCQTKFGWHLLQVLSEREETVLQDVEPEEFHLKMQDPSFHEEAQLLDVREPDEVTQASLPGFQVLPLRQFGSWGAEITTKLDTEKDTYVLCHHGVRSLQVAKWLQTQGFKRVFNISGGIHAYAVKVDPSIPTY